MSQNALPTLHINAAVALVLNKGCGNRIPSVGGSRASPQGPAELPHRPGHRLATQHPRTGAALGARGTKVSKAMGISCPGCMKYNMVWLRHASTGPPV